MQQHGRTYQSVGQYGELNLDSRFPLHLRGKFRQFFLVDFPFNLPFPIDLKIFIGTDIHFLGSFHQFLIQLFLENPLIHLLLLPGKSRGGFLGFGDRRCGGRRFLYHISRGYQFFRFRLNLVDNFLFIQIQLTSFRQFNFFGNGRIGFLSNRCFVHGLLFRRAFDNPGWCNKAASEGDLGKFFNHRAKADMNQQKKQDERSMDKYGPGG